ncbi:MAG TPA: hypothetical protein VEC57_07330 [Candidatus Limnocylindrales bacterium]|nr:hypothetical protein [Candidatus Limnocylindrales bacterium]
MSVAVQAFPERAPAAEVGTNDFRISVMGTDGDTTVNVNTQAVAYNGDQTEYLVVWSADEMLNGEFEIYGQIVAADGSLLGSDFRLSDMGPDLNASYDATVPAVAYNAATNEYLVVWRGNDGTSENDIYGQRVDADGVEVGTNDFRISDVGSLSYAANAPAVTCHDTNGECLVVWEADYETVTANDEIEIFGQLLDGTGNAIGTNDFRISRMGPDNNANYDADAPRVVYNSANDEYFVVWVAEDDSLPLIDGEFEVYGQRLTSAGAETGNDDFRISDVGIDGIAATSASAPAVAYDPDAGEYLVVWSADETSGQSEIHGQRLTASTGAEVGTNDFRISDMGPDGSSSYGAFTPAVAYNGINDEFFVVWQGDDDTSPLVNNEFEVFGQRIASGTGAAVGANDMRLSDMGVDGNVAFNVAAGVSVAFNAASLEYLVAWTGDDTTDGEFEAYGQRVSNCGDSTIDTGEQCDAGASNGAAASCCSATCSYRPVDYICRGAAGECDVAETCTGASASCPSDSLQPADSTCTDDGNACTSDRCDGSSTACQHAAGNAGAVCRAAVDDCDAAEVCDGSSTSCPADVLDAAGTACASDGNPCTVDQCDGVNTACQHPAGNAGATCRAAAGECDAAEICDGADPACPVDAKVASGTSCSDDGNACTEDRCDGSGDACQHPAGNVGAVCRAAAGECDVAETCDGTATCPTDGLTDAGTSCSSDGNPCTIDQCDGASALCQHPAGNAGATCRAAADECDAAELCDGASTTCPGDAKQSADTACTDDGNACTLDRCDGSSDACQHPAGNTGTVCRAAAGECDIAETCDGTATCPSDALVPADSSCTSDGNVCTRDVCDGSSPLCQHPAGNAGTVCRAAAGECDTAETCSGEAAECPADAKAPADTTCSSDGNVCTLDRCDGSSDTCQHPAGNAGTVCRAGSGDLCDPDELCTGSEADCPADVVQPAGTVCRAGSGDLCNSDETCSGTAGAACPADAFEPSTTVCRSAAHDCDSAELCPGTPAGCPSDADLPDGTSCDDGDDCTIDEVCSGGVCGDATRICIDEFVAYRVNSSDAADTLPKGWNVTLNDEHVADGDGDDPENHAAKKTMGLLTPAGSDGTGMAVEPALHYLRYQVGPAGDGASAMLANGAFPPTVAHIPRRWELTNQFGTIVVDSRKVTAMLVPAATGDTGPLVAPSGKNHFLCYQVRTAKGVASDQTPELAPGVTKFRTDLQGYFRDTFDDCATDADGGIGFEGTSVEGHCLYDLKIPVELCSPAAMSEVEPPRESAATIEESNPVTPFALLCYKSGLARVWKSEEVAALAGGTAGARIEPNQSPHQVHSLTTGNPVEVAPASGFISPSALDTVPSRTICVSTAVTDVQMLP